ncbi:MAG TPA: flavodoxin family protein [Dehalococcoidia bacterium]|nr:flavodoxin family protein [Dehalococcoidia bacterium]
MKVLGIAGSPRRNGNTDLLLAELLKGAADRGAEVETIILNDLKFILCQHCDACHKTGKCKYDDDMQAIYRKLAAADRVVLASPVQFMGVTAQTKAMIDRCQALWARKYVLNLPPLGNKRWRKGFFISVSAQKKADLFQPSLATVKALFATLDISYAGGLFFPGVDEKGDIIKHPGALKQAYFAGQKLVED